MFRAESEKHGSIELFHDQVHAASCLEKLIKSSNYDNFVNNNNELAGSTRTLFTDLSRPRAERAKYLVHLKRRRTDS